MRRDDCDDGDARLDAIREGDFTPPPFLRRTLLVRVHQEMIILRRAVTLAELAERLDAPGVRVSGALDTLKASGLVRQVMHGTWRLA